MTGPRIRAASSAAPQFVEPDSMQDRAERLSLQIRQATSAARRGRLDGATVDAIVQSGEAVVLAMDPQDPTSRALRTALRELDEARGVDRSAAAVRRVRSQRTTERPTLRQAVIRFRRGRGSEPLLRALGGSPRSLRALARLSREDVLARVQQAGATREEATEMVDSLQHTAVLRVGTRVRSEVRSAIRTHARELRQAAGSADVEVLAEQFRNPSVLREIEHAGVDTSGLQRALTSGDIAQVRAEVRLAAWSLASNLEEAAAEVAQMNPFNGELFVRLPGAAARAVEGFGVAPKVARGEGDGTLLGDAVAEHARESVHSRESAQFWAAIAFTVGLGVGGAVSGLSAIGGSAVGGSSAALREGAAVSDSYTNAELQGASTAAGMGTEQDVLDARDAAHARLATAGVSVAASIAAPHVGHWVGGAAGARLGMNAERLVMFGAEYVGRSAVEGATSVGTEVVTEAGAHLLGHKVVGH